MKTEQEKITEFLRKKNIHDPLIKDTVTTFINRHTELYNEVIPFDTLLARLDRNLNEIKRIDPQLTPQTHEFKNVVGRYLGFHHNRIELYFSEDSLNNPQLKSDFVETLIHELTHCAYTIKNNDLYETETQVFCTMMELVNGKTSITQGNDTYLEPIINYISSTITNHKNSAYIPQTANMKKLAGTINEKEMVQSAFHSNEIQFKQLFNKLPDGAYEYFTSGMEWFKIGKYEQGQEIMQNFFQRKIPDQSFRQRKIQELKSLRNSLQEIKPLPNTKPLQTSYTKTLKKNGFINFLLLTLLIEIGSVLAIACLSFIF